MNKVRFMALLKALDSYVSEKHGDHEGGYPGNCGLCRIVALIEVIGGVAADLDADEWWDETEWEKEGAR